MPTIVNYRDVILQAHSPRVLSDNTLSIAEKPALILQVATILNEQTAQDIRAAAFGLTTQQVTFDAAVTAMNAHLATLTSPVAWNNLSNTTNLPSGGTYLRSLISAAVVAFEAIETAISNSMLGNLAAIASSNVLTPSGRNQVNIDMGTILSGQASIDNQATSMGVSHTAYDAAISTLQTYLASLGYPSGANWTSGTTNISIVGSTFIANFQAVYAAQQVLLSTSINFVRGNNLIDCSWWTPSISPLSNTGSALGWSANESGAGAADSFVTTTLPDGSSGVAWQATQGAGSNGGGGWNGSATGTTNNFPVNNTKAYLFAVYAKLVSGNGQVYLGVNGSSVDDINTTNPNTNPYFAGGFIPPTGQWCLLIGKVFPQGATGLSNAGAGVYNCANGALIAGGSNYNWDASANYCQTRAYQYYGTAGSVMQFAWPQAFVCDGSEPSVQDLLSMNANAVNALNNAATAQGQANTATANAATAQAQANTATANAAAAQTQANTAATNAAAAQTQLSNIASVNMLAMQDKPVAIQDWNQLSQLQYGIDAQASAAGISHASYDSALTNLSTYLLSLSPSWTDTTQNTVINGAVWNGVWNTAYAAQQTLLNAIAAAAATTANYANLSGTPSTAIANSSVTPSVIGANGGVSGSGNTLFNGDVSQGTSGFGIYNNSGNGNLTTNSPGALSGNYLVANAGSSFGSTFGFVFGNVNSFGGYKANTNYVLSFYAAANGGMVGAGFSDHWNTGPATATWLQNPPLTGGWQRYVVRINFGGNTIDPSTFISTNNMPTAAGQVVIISNLQLEQGDSPSGWNTAPISPTNPINSTNSNSLIGNGAISVAQAQPGLQNSNVTLTSLNAGSFASLSQITTGNIASYIANGAIGALQVGILNAANINVANLAAISAVLGNVTAGRITGSSFATGAFSSWAWPASGAGGGCYIDGNGMLFGNYNTPGASYLEINQDGSISSNYWSVSSNGTLTISQPNVINQSNSSSLIQQGAVASSHIANLSTQTMKTSNYAEDGSGNPTAGVSLNAVGTALKVANSNLQIGTVIFSDYWYRLVQGIDGSVAAGHVIWRGNNDASTRGGAPNINCLQVYTLDDQVINSNFQQTYLKYTITPTSYTSYSDNLDAMTQIHFQFFQAASSSSSFTECYQTCPSRTYDGAAGAVSGSFHWGWRFGSGYPITSQVETNGTYNAYVRVRLANTYGFSATKDFVSSGTRGGLMTATTITGVSGSSGSSGGSSGGACPAPWVKVRLLSGKEIPAGNLHNGSRVAAVDDDTLDILPNGGVIQNFQLIWKMRYRVTLTDGTYTEFSEGHRLAVTDKGWTAVEKIRPGDQIVAQHEAIVSLVMAVGKGQVVSFTVGGAGTYFTDGLLSHNTKMIP